MSHRSRKLPLPNLLLQIAFLLLLLHFAASATSMSESADAEDSTNPPTKSWASDSAGIKPIDALRDANLSDRTIGAKWWITTRRQIIFKLQVTNSLWDCLVDFASQAGKSSYFKPPD